ncbi:spore germination protein [Pseudogracilibacillus auburnensis]|uniref:GerA spore germination protein n=1 Tax=Pseudogracilibacillus auburnensis TaxID=1494959 RepID=A0A2V3VXS6_9BACI|nr:spore germination protein [Pseudogracilibacillus auburnensis]PXW85681.1 GerA spore germination protein [Pseudogracilibacillus auburnensis]
MKSKKNNCTKQDRETEEKINKQLLRKLFQKSADVQFQDYTFNDYNVLFITCHAMIDVHFLNDVIVERVQFFLHRDLDEQPFEELALSHLHVPRLEKIETKAELISKVYTGHVILYFEKFNMIFSSDISNKPNRSPEETKTEMPVKGPRDNFIEDVSINIALIRKRLPTNSLCVETFELGKRTKTTVAVLYFEDIVNKDILHGIKEKMEKVDIDIVFSGDILMEYIDKRSRLFPRHDYTGRPDFAVQSLARGRVFILVDGVAYGVITPVNIFLLFKSGEDNEYPIIFSSLERILRVAGILIGAFLPAFWLALTTYHQNQLPIQLLATVVKSSTGLPFPAALEMLLMLVMFELFREAGLRLPDAIGGTLSVVGGLIIGDAAIRAGITSPAMVVIIAVSVISTFTLLNQSLVSAVSIIRIIAILFTAFFGLFGFFITIYFALFLLANIRIFGVPYLNIGSNTNWSTIKKTIFRSSQQEYTKRPSMLKTTDNTRTNEDEK